MSKETTKPQEGRVLYGFLAPDSQNKGGPTALELLRTVSEATTAHGLPNFVRARGKYSPMRGAPGSPVGSRV